MSWTGDDWESYSQGQLASGISGWTTGSTSPEVFTRIDLTDNVMGHQGAVANPSTHWMERTMVEDGTLDFKYMAETATEIVRVYKNGNLQATYTNNGVGTLTSATSLSVSNGDVIKWTFESDVDDIAVDDLVFTATPVPNTDASADDAQVSTSVSGVNVYAGFVSYGEQLIYNSSYGDKSDSEAPFYSSDWLSYNPATDDAYSPGSIDASTFLPVNVPDGANLTLSFRYYGGDLQDDIRILKSGVLVWSKQLGGLPLNTITETIEIPAGRYDLEIRSGPVNLDLYYLEVERLPVEIDSADCQPECDQVDVLFDPGVQSAQSAAEAQTVAVALGDFFITGSFESGLNGWTAGDDWVRTDEDAYDGDWSMRGSLTPSAGGGSSPEVLSKALDTTGQGVSQFRFAVKLVGDFPYWAGLGIYDNGVEIKRLNAWWAGSDIPTNQWVEVGIELDEGVHNIEMRLDQHPDLSSSHYVYFDDFGVRNVDVVLDVNSLQSNAQNEAAPLGIAGIGLAVDDAEASSQASDVDINIPIMADDVESAAQAEQVTLSAHSPLTVDSVEAASQAEAPLLTGDAVLEVDSAESQAEIRKFGLDISPVDIASPAFVQAVKLVVNSSLPVDSVEAASEASAVQLTGNASLEIDDAESAAEALDCDATFLYRLTIQNAESKSEVHAFAVQQVIAPTDVSLCTPSGDNEDVVSTIAGEEIAKGEVVRVDNNDVAYKASSLTHLDSQYTGFAVNSAAAGMPVVVAVDGTVVLGPVLRPNQMYVLSSRPGRIKHASEVAPGEFISLVGIATSNTSLRIGSDFQSLLMTSQTLESVSGNVVTPVPASVKIEGTDPPATGRSGATESIVIGDVLNRSQRLAEAASVEDSSFLGVAVSDALSGCSIAYVTEGAAVDLGASVLQENRIYVVSRQRGRVMLADELEQGDYATVVGLAVSDRVLQLGAITKGTLAI